MKKIFFLSLLFFSLKLSAQQDCEALKKDPDMRQELQDLANSAASKLMSCCSSWGGKNCGAEIHWGADADGNCLTRISKISGRITITMTASWTGSLSGTHYWIKGRLIIDKEAGRQWEKIEDSGGFSPGCSKSCIN